jgi:hypothetical protein
MVKSWFVKFQVSDIVIVERSETSVGGELVSYLFP